MGYMKKVLEGRPVAISSDVLNMLPGPASKVAAMIDSYWTEEWVKYSDQSSANLKLSTAKAMVAWPFMLIEEAETEVHDMELTKKSSKTALQNADKIIKDRDHFQDQVTWLQGSLFKLKNELKILAEDRDKLRVDLASSEVDLAEFLMKYNHTNHAQEVTAKALEDANSQRDGMVEKMAQLENAKELLKTECSSLKEKNHKLERNTEEKVKAGVENFLNHFEFTRDYENLQFFFVNFGARQVLAELKKLHPTVNILSIEADYPTPTDDGDAAAQPPLMEHRLGHFVFCLFEKSCNFSI
ncbi:uncharacterized protein Fot_38512 [Forsythia ovata]|uniref:Uncharacterized protein n=1 Tax=Forsythia ovata TaxID=205694 RepID=A0ABD1S217_9LAMI